MTSAPEPAGFTAPAYGDRSLADVVPSVARALGVALDGHPDGLELPPAPSYVVFLVDGMGAELLARYAHAAPYLSSLADGSNAKQRITASGRLMPPRPGDLRAAVLSARTPPRPEGRPSWLQRGAGVLRAGLQRACEPLPDDSGGLLQPGYTLAYNGTGKPETVRTAEQEAGIGRPISVRVFIGDRDKDYPKPDGKTTFDKLSSVFLTGNATRDDAPNHIRIQDKVPLEIALMWQNMCPAQVYEVPEEELEAARNGNGGLDGKREVKLQITPSNCVQCGAITAKGGRLTPPEGGAGPEYTLT